MSAISKYSNYAQFQNCNSKLNAMIQFDKSGTPGQIIGSDGTNGLIWVDSDPSSASYWSEYPATQNVDIADQNIDNVDTIELVNIIDSSGSSGTDTQLLSQDAVGAKWIDQSDVIEKWSQYPATQTIDASGNDIENVNNFTASNIVVETSGGNTSILSSTNLTFNGIPYNRNMINSTLVYSSAAIYADSTYPPATNLLIRNTYGYSGWAFINTAVNSKFNYYFAPQSPTTQVQDIKGISFNYFNVTQTSNDYQIFCTIYTKPQPGDVTFYHSKRNYIFDQSITPTINTAYQACVLVDKSLISYYYETQIQYQLDPLNQVGPFLPTEEILAITLASDSACPAGTMSVVLSKLNIIMNGFTKEFQLVSP